MRLLAQLETNIRNCLAHIHQLRDENERIRRDAEDMARELAAIHDRRVDDSSVKQTIIDELESLVTRIDDLHIDSITND